MAKKKRDALGDFAEEVGRLLGTTERKASEWLRQRTVVASKLAAVRDQAQALLSKLNAGDVLLPGKSPGARAAKKQTRRKAQKSTAAQRDQQAAERFFRRLLRGQRIEPLRVTTDKLRSYSAAMRTVLPNVKHIVQEYANNRAEVSHQWTRQRERQMRRFKSARHAQRFLSLHDAVHNLFRVRRPLLTSSNYRLLRSRSFAVWNHVTAR